MRKKAFLLTTTLLVCSYFIYNSTHKHIEQSPKRTPKIEASKKVETQTTDQKSQHKANHKLFISEVLDLIENENIEELEKQLKNGQDPNIHFNKRKFSILMDQSKNCNPKIVSLLVKYGAELNHQDTYGNTALHYAVMNGDIACVEILIKAGSDKEVFNKDSKRAIDISKRYKFDEVTELLLE